MAIDKIRRKRKRTDVCTITLHYMRTSEYFFRVSRKIGLSKKIIDFAHKTRQTNIPKTIRQFEEILLNVVHKNYKVLKNNLTICRFKTIK